jgi:hypothetical protein
MWAAILHWVSALLNGKFRTHLSIARLSVQADKWQPGCPVCALLKYVTKFPCETFGFYVAMVYREYRVYLSKITLGSSLNGSIHPLSPSKCNLDQTTPKRQAQITRFYSTAFRSSPVNSISRMILLRSSAFCESLDSDTSISSSS